MPKWKASYESGRKYSSQWEKEYPWCKLAPDGSGSAFCKVCNVSIFPKISSLKTHQSSNKHKSNTPGSANTLDANVIKTPRQKSAEEKTVDIHLSVAMACHCSIMTIDHLGDIVKRHGKGSILKNLNLHRTKCSGLIKNVISPSLKSVVISDIKGKHFALLCDESTDISTQKHMCILARYLSCVTNKIETSFLGLIPVHEATGENLFNVINEEVKSCGQDLSNCIGFASDGANNMMGCNNSVWTRVKSMSPNCVPLKCICHSLALCIQYAVGKLPSNIGFLLTEIPHWFCNSDLRREAFKTLFSVMNPPDQDIPRAAPLPFEKTSNTRWLVRGKVMYNLLLNWEELKAYFTACENAQDNIQVKFKARLIKEMLNDNVNLLYFEFVTPLVQEFERVNSMFQQTNADPHELYNQLYMHSQSLINRINTKDGHKKPIEQVDFGAKFLLSCTKYLANRGHDDAAKIKIQDVKGRCLQALEEAVAQVNMRLPESKNTFHGLSKLNPSIVLNQVTRPPFSTLPFLYLIQDKIDTVEEQYRKLILVDWSKEEPFNTKGKIPENTEQFWSDILTYNKHFKDLATYALTCLITPCSNAVVERTFSLVTSIKTKPRNRMQINMLDALVRIRSHLIYSNKCCKDFIVTTDMLDRFNFKQVYSASAIEVSSSSTSPDEEEMLLE